MTSSAAADEDEPTALDPDGPNALARAIGLLGDEWTLLILRHAMSGATRYSDFAASLPISNAVLTSRLDTLVRERLMERRVYQDHPVRAEYVLTHRGRAVWPVLVAMWAWELQWVPEHEYRTPPMAHRVCGARMSPLYSCSACGEPAPAGSLTTEWGPSGGWRRSVPEVRTRRRSGTRAGSRAGSREVGQTFYPNTMAVFGNRWSAAVVGAAFLGIRRFTDFQDLLGAPPSLLAERLSSLSERGILRQQGVTGRPDWTEYALTAQGLSLFPVVALSLEWGQRWYTAHEGPVVRWTHDACGAPFRGVLTCDQCREVLRPRDIELDERP